MKEQQKISYIYCFTNLINGKKYIGSTIQEPNIRYNQHIYNATHKNAHQYNYPLYQAIRKYGIENFSFSILLEQNCTEQEIRLIEKDYIKKENTLSPFGYNQTENTEHPINDIQSYKKMSKTKREKAKKVALVDQHNNIIQVFRSIVDCAEEMSLDERKISACCRGERKSYNKYIFYWLDDDNSLIIPKYQRDPYKGEKGTTQIQSSSKQVEQLDIKTNKVIKIYDTIALAARENNCDSSAISKVCKGIRQSCGGFKWRYVNK